MELFILIISLAMFVELNFLVFVKYRPQKTGKRKIYIDTSVLIDGRILDIARSGFLDGDIIILRSVLKELQLLADGKDSEKRTKARAGLEAVSELERVVNVNTEVINDGEGPKKVDDQLLRFAKANKGVVLTIDYNLIKVAEAEKLECLNINDLALAVKTDFLPGEQIDLKITDKGTNRGQGVGHLPNGAMVVVDQAANKVGKNVPIEFVRFHETSAGRIIFAKLARKKKKSKAKSKK